MWKCDVVAKRVPVKKLKMGVLQACTWQGPLESHSPLQLSPPDESVYDNQRYSLSNIKCSVSLDEIPARHDHSPGHAVELTSFLAFIPG